MKTPPIEQLPFLLAQFSEQLNDLKDTAGTICRMIEKDRAKREKMPDVIVLAGWTDCKDEMPMTGERVVIKRGNNAPYFLTYFEGCGIKFDKWYRLPPSV